MPGLKQVFIQALTEVSTEAKDSLGDIRWEGNKCYKYVEFKNTTATVVGVVNDVCAYQLAGYASSIVVQDMSDASTKPIGAGLILATVAGVLTVSYFIWVQIKGPATIATDIGTTADGDALFKSTTDLALVVASAADDPVCAYADDDSAQLVVLDCVF